MTQNIILSVQGRSKTERLCERQIYPPNKVKLWITLRCPKNFKQSSMKLCVVTKCSNSMVLWQKWRVKRHSLSGYTAGNSSQLSRSAFVPGLELKTSASLGNCTRLIMHLTERRRQGIRISWKDTESGTTTLNWPWLGMAEPDPDHSRVTSGPEAAVAAAMEAQVGPSGA